MSSTIVFNVGDMVLVKAGRSKSSKIYSGHMGIITDVSIFSYAVLDIEGNEPGGIWLDELQLVGITSEDFEYV